MGNQVNKTQMLHTNNKWCLELILILCNNNTCFNNKCQINGWVCLKTRCTCKEVWWEVIMINQHTIIWVAVYLKLASIRLSGQLNSQPPIGPYLKLNRLLLTWLNYQLETKPKLLKQLQQQALHLLHLQQHLTLKPLNSFLRER